MNNQHFLAGHAFLSQWQRRGRRLRLGGVQLQNSQVVDWVSSSDLGADVFAAHGIAVPREINDSIAANGARPTVLALPWPTTMIVGDEQYVRLIRHHEAAARPQFQA